MQNLKTPTHTTANLYTTPDCARVLRSLRDTSKNHTERIGAWSFDIIHTNRLCVSSYYKNLGDTGYVMLYPDETIQGTNNHERSVWLYTNHNLDELHVCIVHCNGIVYSVGRLTL